MQKLVLIFMFAWPLACLGFEPLITDDAAVVGVGANQLEIYFTAIYQHGANTNSPGDTISPDEEFSSPSTARGFPITYTRGIFENIEASFSSTYFTQPSGNFQRIANNVLGLKWRFIGNSESQFAAAIKPIVILPATTQQQVNGLASASTNYGSNFIISRYWENIELHINAAYLRGSYNSNYSVGQSFDTRRVNLYFLTAAPVWNIMPGVKIALDFGLTTNPPKIEQALNNYGMLALIISPYKNIDLGFSVMRTAANFGVVMNGAGENTARTEMGVTWRF